MAAHRRAHDASARLPEGVGRLDGLAIDGKTIGNCAAPGLLDVKLFFGLTHHEQVVIAQVAVPEHTAEVTCVPVLLDPVALTGKVVTADAAHTRQPTADYLVTTPTARPSYGGNELTPTFSHGTDLD